MSKEIENNRLIAEFDGWRYHSANANQIIETVDGVKHGATFNEHGVWENVELRKSRYVHNYDKNWSQLMPVVEKIQKTEVSNRHKLIINTAGAHSCSITVWYYVQNVGSPCFQVWESKSDNFIENVYSAVIQFIKWYNENKQP